MHIYIYIYIYIYNIGADTHASAEEEALARERALLEIEAQFLKSPIESLYISVRECECHESPLQSVLISAHILKSHYIVLFVVS